MKAPTNPDFSSLKLSPAQLTNLHNLGYLTMTPIQAQGLPLVLAGRDLIAKAKTGSGKTATFGLGLLENVEAKSFKVQALVLCPTRELAEQVSQELRRLAQGIANIKLVTICGGKPFGPQKASLAYGAHIVVGTPGRILDHLERGTLKLKNLRTLVLDEADRMLDMGFSETMDKIVASAPPKRQTLLFSATFPDEIARMSRTIQNKPVTVSVDAQHDSGVIEQVFYEIKKHERNSTLLALFEHYTPESALVFCHTKRQCDEVANFLNQQQIQALAIHGDLEQRDRDRVLLRFSNNSCAVLVATDVAARGLDIKALPLVINYELPRDPEVYVHRIGRTGRAGEHGAALSLYTEAEQFRVNQIAEYTATPAICDVPESLDSVSNYQLHATMRSIEINAGKKQKIRPGDLLGALTGEAGLPGNVIGKIDIKDMASFVAVERAYADDALAFFTSGKVKGRSIKARFV